MGDERLEREQRAGGFRPILGLPMTRTPDEIQALFLPLYADLKPEDQFDIRKPLLAHYTSLEVLESVAKTNEIWFSNPLFMNDLEEVKFGVLNGIKAARECKALESELGTGQKHERFFFALNHYFDQFDKEHVFDTYVFCTSEYDPTKPDGKLSMWRGYGGNGRGVALVFDMAKMNMVPPPTPIIVAQVRYETIEHRNQYLGALCDQTAHIIQENSLDENQVYLAAHMLFDRFKLFALFTKHAGFEEEHEWRAVYRREFDHDKKFDKMFGYALGPNGVEPKLKFKVEPVAGATTDDLSLEKLLHSIILGPTASSVLAQASVKRMLEQLNRPQLAERVFVSSIPLRPN